jgi:hypothetical protein
MSNANIVYDDRAADMARAAALKQWGIDVAKPAQVIPIRKPLGLAPGPADDDIASDRRPDNFNTDDSVILHDGRRFSFMDGTPREVLDGAATVELVYIMGNSLISLDDSAHQRAKAMGVELRGEVARIELENARLKVAVSELTAKVDTLTFISERLRLENRGPIGPPGPMGRDGVEGRPGARGERDERGETGSAAPMIVGWRIDSDRHLCTPQYSDGSSGAPLNLSSFVEDEPEADEE